MKKLGLVMGSFHKDLVEKQRQEVTKTAEELGAIITEEVWVPGSVEKPLAIKRLLQKEEIDATRSTVERIFSRLDVINLLTAKI